MGTREERGGEKKGERWLIEERELEKGEQRAEREKGLGKMEEEAEREKKGPKARKKWTYSERGGCLERERRKQGTREKR